MIIVHKPKIKAWNYKKQYKVIAGGYDVIDIKEKQYPQYENQIVEMAKEWRGSR